MIIHNLTLLLVAIFCIVTCEKTCFEGPSCINLLSSKSTLYDRQEFREEVLLQLSAEQLDQAIKGVPTMLQKLGAVEDFAAIRIYTGPSYSDINDDLRTSPLVPNRFREVIICGSSGLNKMKKVEQISFRGSRQQDKQFLDDKWAKGKTYTSSNFQSSSLVRLSVLSICLINLLLFICQSLTQAMAFADKGNGGIRTIWVIKTKSGAYVSSLSMYSYEKEVLVPPGATFKILQSKWIDNYRVFFTYENSKGNLSPNAEKELVEKLEYAFSKEMAKLTKRDIEEAHKAILLKQMSPKRSIYQQVPANWTCLDSYYNASDGCDCECNAWDPDCDIPNPIYGCNNDSSPTCIQPGSCSYGITPPGWLCSPNYYASSDGCDCECGLYDPDCDISDDIVFDCLENQTCSLGGHCVFLPAIPSTWICPQEYYASGDGCDCNCGATDPDCLANNRSLADFGCPCADMLCSAGYCVGYCNGYTLSYTDHPLTSAVNTITIVLAVLLGLVVAVLLFIVIKSIYQFSVQKRNISKGTIDYSLMTNK